MPSWIDLSGQRFGLLTAVSYTLQTLSSGRKMSAWVCRCDCGNQVTSMTVNLAKGKPYSCGCTPKPSDGAVGVNSIPEYRIYRQMLDRCYLKTARNYPWYGAKGVTVCDRWRFGEDGRTGFLCFYGDMGPRPEGLTLDRNKPHLGYSPDNCSWQSWEFQANNKREHYLDERERRDLRRERGQKSRKITDDMIRYIQGRLASGKTQMAIQAETGVRQSTVSKIKLGQIAPIAGREDGRALCLFTQPRSF